MSERMKNATLEGVVQSQDLNQRFTRLEGMSIELGNNYDAASKRLTKEGTAREQLQVDVTALEETADELKRDTLRMSDSVDELKRDTLRMRESFDELKRDTLRMRESFDELKRDTLRMRESFDELKRDTLSTRESFDELKRDTLRMRESFDEHKESIDELTREIQKMKTEKEYSKYIVSLLDLNSLYSFENNMADRMCKRSIGKLRAKARSYGSWHYIYDDDDEELKLYKAVSIRNRLDTMSSDCAKKFAEVFDPLFIDAVKAHFVNLATTGAIDEVDKMFADQWWTLNNYI